MNNSIAEMSVGVEYLSKEDWEDIAKASDEERTTMLWEAEEPLGECAYPGVEPIAVYGFSEIDDHWSPTYFWFQRAGSDPASRWREPSSRVRRLIEFGLHLSRYCDEQHTLEILRSIVADTNGGTDLSFLDDKCHVYWVGFSGQSTKFAALYRSDIEDPNFSSESIGNCLIDHFDFFRLRSPVWECVPIAYLARESDGDVDKLGSVLLDPKCFDPRKPATREGRFLWPWQRSIGQIEDSSKFEFQPIGTTSLVFDIRKSTMVLEQLPDSERGRFPEFLRRVMHKAKAGVFRHGGFFDKETGDGIVAHFSDFSMDGERVTSSSLRAFSAARDILTDIREFCDEVQDYLHLGVGGLGGSIGIHSSEAVWTCENGLVSALGDSVIMAARLCGEADNYAIFVSNSEFHRLTKDLSAAEIQRFAKQPYSGKEWNSGAELYGMQFSSGCNSL